MSDTYIGAEKCSACQVPVDNTSRLPGTLSIKSEKAFDDSDCEVMQSAMRVKNRTGSYYYPENKKGDAAVRLVRSLFS